MLTKAKEWGNSIGIIIPSDVVKELNIKPGDELSIPKIEKQGNVLNELFGALPGLKRKDLEEYRKEVKWSKYD
ncbi:AbrB/MazE/SpoVT family DNA-binding domain-containing protein [Candidatus Woesearchaeota archaeon]|nr:AbrB/MazE/SpoVT family DNA-binding domain-containing protein [Candidatus Woesearchaeota archaeon]